MLNPATELDITKQILKTVTRPQGSTPALKKGDVVFPEFELDFEEVGSLPRAYNAPITAIPEFLVRDLHHKAIFTGLSTALTDPKELEGQRVGVNSGFTVTTGIRAGAISELTTDPHSSSRWTQRPNPPMRCKSDCAQMFHA